LRLEQLPYDICNANTSEAHALSTLVVDTNFQYKDIIDPSELANIEARIQERREQFDKNISEIDTFNSQSTEIFDSISEVLADSKSKLQLIRQNKDSKLGEAFIYSQFSLGIFDEEVQDEYLKQQKNLLESMQLEIETSLGVNLTHLLKAIHETELLSVTAAQAIDSNTSFAFLEYRQKLQMKRQECIDGNSTLALQVQDISRQPLEKSQELNAQLQKLLGISIIPGGHLGALLPIHQAVAKFSTAFRSGHPVYSEAREKTKSKLQGFCIAHAAIAVLVGGSVFAVNNEQKPFILGAASTYGISAGTLFMKKKQLQ
jgi:hypothetical protein